MKAKERHELKTNELAEWLGRLPEWGRRNLTTIIIAAAIVAVGVGSFIYLRYQKKDAAARQRVRVSSAISSIGWLEHDIVRAQLRGVDASAALLNVAKDLQSAAAGVQDRYLAALAYIKRAQALRAELYYRPGPVSKGELNTRIKQARASYSEALARLTGSQQTSGTASSGGGASQPGPNAKADGDQDIILEGLARFGLAICDEELGNLEQARKQYEALAADERFSGTLVAAEAQWRLQTMADYQKKVVFAVPGKAEPAGEPLVELTRPRPRAVEANVGAAGVDSGQGNASPPVGVGPVNAVNSP